MICELFATFRFVSDLLLCIAPRTTSRMAIMEEMTLSAMRLWRSEETRRVNWNSNNMKYFRVNAKSLMHIQHRTAHTDRHTCVTVQTRLHQASQRTEDRFIAYSPRGCECARVRSTRLTSHRALRAVFATCKVYPAYGVVVWRRICDARWRRNRYVLKLELKMATGSVWNTYSAGS